MEKLLLFMVFASILAVNYSQETEERRPARKPFCPRFERIFQKWCVRRTRTTQRNDFDAENFCPVYAERCNREWNPDRIVGRERPRQRQLSELERFCLNTTNQENAFKHCRRFPRQGPGFYNSCHRFLIQCRDYFEPDTTLKRASDRALNARALGNQFRDLSENLARGSQLRPRPGFPETVQGTLAAANGNFYRNYRFSNLARGYLGQPGLSPVQYDFLRRKYLQEQGVPVQNTGALVAWVDQFAQLHPNLLYTDLRGELTQSDGFPSAGNWVAGLPYIGRNYPAITG